MRRCRESRPSIFAEESAPEGQPSGADRAFVEGATGWTPSARQQWAAVLVAEGRLPKDRAVQGHVTTRLRCEPADANTASETAVSDCLGGWRAALHAELFGPADQPVSRGLRGLDTSCRSA